MQKKFLIAGSATLAFVALLILYITFFTTSRALIPRPVEEYLPKGARHAGLPSKNEEPTAAAIPQEWKTEAVPDGLAGWESYDLPLSDSEVLNMLTAKALAFDHYGYRLYKNATFVNGVTIYIAYWGPGKVSTTDAGVHNPDSCWTNSGWKRVMRRSGVEYSAGGRKLKPVEYGIYERPGDGPYKGKMIRMPVIFWHLVGGEVNRYETQWEGYKSGLKGRIERLPILFEDLKKYGLNQRREQMFVRITLDRPMDEMLKSPDFVRLLNSLAPLAIFEGSSWEDLSKQQDAR
jgi:hypothetical protein